MTAPLPNPQADTPRTHPHPVFATSEQQMSRGERAALEGVLSELNPRLAIEIGTAEGASLGRIAAHAAEVHSFDLFAAVLPATELAHVTLHTGDSHELLRPFLAQLAEAGCNVDFVLLDGDHSSEGVQRDLEDLLDSPALGNTTILIHDTSNPTVRRGLDAVDYAARDKVALVELDWIAGYVFTDPHFRDELWGGLGHITVDAGRTSDRGSPIQSRYVPIQPLLQRAIGDGAAPDSEARARLRAAEQSAREQLARGDAEHAMRVAAQQRVAELERRLAGDGQRSTGRGLRRLRTAIGSSAPAAASQANDAPAPPGPEPASDPAERWFREHYDEAAGHVLAFLEAGGISMEGKEVADVGSGDGIIDLALAHRGQPSRLVGYDLRRTDSENLAAQAARYGVAEIPPQLVFAESQILRLPAPDDSFDIVVTWSAFEHISDPVSVATEMRRILRPDGVLFLQLWPFHRSERGSHLWDWFPEPHHHLLEHEGEIVERMRSSDVHDPGFTSYMADEFEHLNRITLEELHRSLLAGGFRVARVELMTGAVQCPPALSRYSLADMAISGIKLLAS